MTKTFFTKKTKTKTSHYLSPKYITDLFKTEEYNQKQIKKTTTRLQIMEKNRKPRNKLIH